MAKVPLRAKTRLSTLLRCTASDGSHAATLMIRRMTPSPRAIAALLSLALLAACTRGVVPSPPQVSAEPRVPVVIVSLDGFHPDYLDRGLTPRLNALADEGVRGAGMTPSYPSLTFPNHYTLVTGVRPDTHGIVHNTMRDPVLGDFKSSDEAAASDARWWNGAEPLWVTAERAGLPTATMFWPGSQAAIRGVRPTHWRPYDESIGNDARVDQLVAWLDVSAAQQPRFATLYIEVIDEVGHAFGPRSAEMDVAIARVDASIGRLADALDARGIRANLLIVSDHGMAEVPRGQFIAAEDMVDTRQADIVTIGQVVGLQPRRGHARAVEAAVLGRHDRYECWKKGELPARWRYGTHARVPAIVCQMDEGWDAIWRADFAKRPPHSRGSHGYDPALPSMRALFIARGPAFRAGARLPVFDNVDVYPLLARLAGVGPQPHEGTIEPLLPALR
jgi:predicted AlkP superfamily pyrophosphatase or phosphodiesterase